jgi:hypothetical protein
MHLTLNRRITVVWAFLCVVTVVSWLLASARGHREFSPSAGVTIGILVAVAVKARLIIRRFMEVRTAPTWLRVVTDVWLTVLVGSIFALYQW